MYKTLTESFETQNSVLNELKIRWFELNDEEITRNIDSLIIEIELEKYTANELIDALKIFSSLIDLGFNIDYDNIYDKIKLNIFKEKPEFFKEIKERLSFQLYNNNDERFKASIGDIEYEIIARIQKEERSKLNDCLKDTNLWGEKLYNLVSGKDQNYYLNTKHFLSLFEIKILIVCLQQSNAKNIMYFREALRKVYSFSNLSDVFKDDTKNLSVLISTLKNNKEYKGKTSRLQLKYLYEDLLLYKARFDSSELS